jgi:hypothetical protein
MNYLVLVFHPDGNGRCLWTEALPLASIGKLTMRRASVVEFNEQRQQWEVKPPEDSITVLFASQSREQCLQWEHQHFNQQLADSIT